MELWIYISLFLSQEVYVEAIRNISETIRWKSHWASIRDCHGNVSTSFPLGGLGGRRVARSAVSQSLLPPPLSFCFPYPPLFTAVAIIFFARYYRGQLFQGVRARKLLPPRFWRNSLGSWDVSNVLESVERELNMGISSAEEEEEEVGIQPPFEFRGCTWTAEESLPRVLVLRTRDPGILFDWVRYMVYAAPDTTCWLYPGVLHCLSPRLDIRWTVEKSSRPIRYHQFSLRACTRPPYVSDTDSSNGFIRNKVSRFMPDAFAVENPLVVIIPRVPSWSDCVPEHHIRVSVMLRSTKRFLNRTSPIVSDNHLSCMYYFFPTLTKNSFWQYITYVMERSVILRSR